MKKTEELVIQALKAAARDERLKYAVRINRALPIIMESEKVCNRRKREDAIAA